jgi:hypothetical protein
MKKFSVALLALAAALAISPAALADTYDFTISGSGITSSGILTVAATSTPGTYDITGITGTFADTNGGYSGSITGLYPDPSYSEIITTSYLFSLDNLFYPAGSPNVCFWETCSTGSQIDIAGIVFDVTGGYEVGIWGNGTGNPYGLNSDLDGVYQDNGNNGVNVSFDASAATPEPSSLLLLGTGLLGLAVVLFRKAKSSAPVLHLNS